MSVQMITIGQYLRPSDRHLPVDRFPEPSSFMMWDEQARKMGFEAVACGPLVRSVQGWATLRRIRGG